MISHSSSSIKLYGHLELIQTYARNNDVETPNDVRNNDFEIPNDVNFDADNAE